MSRYVNSYQELVEIEQTRLDVLLENTTIDNLFTTIHQKLYTDRLYRYYYNKSDSHIQSSGDTILIVPKSGCLTQRVIYLNPDLVGGTIAGTQAINITQQDGSIRLQDKGAVNATSLIRFLRSLFYAFGIEVDESKVNLIDLCDVVLSDFEFIYNRENGGSILIDGSNFDNIDVMYILENGITYFDEDLVQAFANKMYEAGWFDFEYELITDLSDIPLHTLIDYGTVSMGFSKEMVTYAINQAYKNGVPVMEVDLRDHINEIYSLIEANMPTELYDANYPWWVEVRPSITVKQARVKVAIAYNNSNKVKFTNEYTDAHGNIALRGEVNSFVYLDTDYPNKKAILDVMLNKNIYDANAKPEVSISYGGTGNAIAYAGSCNTVDPYTYNKGSFVISNIGAILQLHSKVDGVTVIDGAKVPSALDSLSTDYPTWYERLNSWVGTGISKVGETLRNTFNVIDFVPLTLLGNTPEQAQSGEVTMPDIVGVIPEIVVRDLDPFPTSDEPSDDPYDPSIPEATPSLPPPLPTPTPSVAPIDPTPSITSGKLFTVYNPTTDDINNLGGFLWGESVAGILAELFSNPMDAIISLNVIYATPSIGERRNIVLGYVKSDDITAPIVTSQYITLDCGTVRVPEYYGNATDYAPFSCASIYLPFIGFRDVNINEIMGSEVNINYKVDVYTGTVYASVSTIRNNITQVLYTYEGNCAVQIPLTGGDRSRLLGGVVGAVAGLVAGSPAMAIGSIASGFYNGATSNKQGSIGANAGAMGIKNPYIVITNTQSYDAYNYNKQYGFPANASILLGNCKGFTRVKSVHVSSISNATNEEKQNIDTLLKQGVIIN